MRLLLIEDDKRVARFIQKGLTAERYRVELASKGPDGIEMGLTGVYDLILLDLILPEETGFEVCRQLRENQIITPIQRDVILILIIDGHTQGYKVVTGCEMDGEIEFDHEHITGLAVR